MSDIEKTVAEIVVPLLLPVAEFGPNVIVAAVDQFGEELAAKFIGKLKENGYYIVKEEGQ